MTLGKKLQKAMAGAGVCSLVVGIIILAVGIAGGVLSIINGARLLRHSSDMNL